MPEIFHDINWILFGALIVVSALVSWAGDVVGMKLGRKRITLFGLRPKYTSRIISVLTGVGVAVVTICVLSAASEQVRTALFSMQVLQRQLISAREELKDNEEKMSGLEIDFMRSRGELSEKEDELREIEDKLEKGMKNLEETQAKLTEMTKMRDETEAEQAELEKENARLKSEGGKLEASVKSLKKESESLKSGIRHLRESRVTAFSGEILAQGVLTDDNTNKEEAERCIERLTASARAMLAYRSGAQDTEPPKIEPAAEEKAVKQLMQGKGRRIVRITALGNAVEGEPVPARVEIYQSKLIYAEGTPLYTRVFTRGTERHEIEESIFHGLRLLNRRAAADGILRDPVTGNIGSIDSDEFVAAIDEIAQSDKTITLEMVAERDIYSEGPLRVKFTLK